ncbi:MAG: EamA family transporter [Betaproteobacteria bacterium]
MIDFRLQRHALTALGAAALFGASTPLAKLLLGDVAPVGLAALLYLGSGSGLLILWLLQKTWKPARNEAPLSRRDLPWLVGAVATGGVIAPVLLLWGLAGTAASTASLLLNVEGTLTTLVAALVFREAVAGRVWLATLLLLVAASVLVYRPDVSGNWSVHSLALIGACLFWAVDNNLTRRISASDPVAIAMIKGLGAGCFNLALAFVLGVGMPAGGSVAGALLVGFAGYGVSLVLFIHAMRHLGSARAGAHFSTAPFMGAAIAVLLLGDEISLAIVAATLVMAVATWLVLSERHAHLHTHEAHGHDHRHVHDTHHQHAHDREVGPEPHSHEHQHEPLTHAHPHLPDLHHRHQH